MLENTYLAPFVTPEKPAGPAKLQRQEARAVEQDRGRTTLTPMPTSYIAPIQDMAASSTGASSLVVEGDSAQTLKNILAAGGEDGVFTSDELAATKSEPTTVIDWSATREARKNARVDAREATPDAKQMTWDQYTALNDQQQTAVDFNTLLVRAREKDLNADFGEQRLSDLSREGGEYDTALEKIFGPGNDGSLVFAPETVAVLQQLNWKPVAGEVGSSIDDFLGLKVALTGKDVKGLSVAEDAPIGTEAPAPTGLAQIQADMIDSTATLQKALAETGTFLENFQKSAMLDRTDELGWLGIDAATPKPGLGYGMGTLDQDFRASFDLLANGATTQDGETIGQVMQFLTDSKSMDAFMRYSDERTTNARRYSIPLGETPEVQYRTPQEFRTLLGLDKES